MLLPYNVDISNQFPYPKLRHFRLLLGNKKHTHGQKKTCFRGQFAQSLAELWQLRYDPSPFPHRGSSRRRLWHNLQGGITMRRFLIVSVLPNSPTRIGEAGSSLTGRVADYSRPRNVGTLDKTDKTVGEGLVGAPAVRDLVSLNCPSCANRFDANSAAMLCGSISRSTPIPRSSAMSGSRRSDAALRCKNLFLVGPVQSFEAWWCLYRASEERRAYSEWTFGNKERAAVKEMMSLRHLSSARRGATLHCDGNHAPTISFRTAGKRSEDEVSRGRDWLPRSQKHRSPDPMPSKTPTTTQDPPGASRPPRGQHLTLIWTP